MTSKEQPKGNEAPPSPFAVFRYFGTANLGDAIQTIALARLLPGCSRGIERATAVGPDDAFWVVNGWLGNNAIPPVTRAARTLFAGVYVAQEHNLEWLARSPFPVGSRDPSTHTLLQKAGLATEMIGCPSLTFPRYEGIRSGSYAVDVEHPEIPSSAITMTHDIWLDVPWPEQWRGACQALEYYRTAELVYTTRLHVVLPCLAFGTPVVFFPPAPPRVYPDDRVDERLSLLQALKVPYGEVVEMDITPFANSYRAFLERHLKIAINDESVFPAECPL